MQIKNIILIVCLVCFVSCKKDETNTIKQWTDQEWSQLIGFEYDDNVASGVYLDGNLLVDFTTAQVNWADDSFNIDIRNGKTTIAKIVVRIAGKDPKEVGIVDIKSMIVTQLPHYPMYEPVYFLFNNGQMTQTDVVAFYSLTIREIVLNSSCDELVFNACLVVSGFKYAFIYRGKAIPNQFIA